MRIMSVDLANRYGLKKFKGLAFALITANLLINLLGQNWMDKSSESKLNEINDRVVLLISILCKPVMDFNMAIECRMGNVGDYRPEFRELY